MKTFNLSNKNISHKSKNTVGGFTLVETLVAITILMIAIAGPLAIVSKGMRTALYSKDQMTAMFLAQETMESVKNARDSAIENGGDAAWLNNIVSGIYCTQASSSCDLSPLSSGLQINSPLPDHLFPIYFNPSTGFTPISSGASKSIFRRGFYLETPPAPYDADQRIVHVFVRWEEGTIPFETELTSLLVKQRL